MIQTPREMILEPLNNRLQNRIEMLFRMQKVNFLNLFLRTKSFWAIEIPVWVEESEPPPIDPLKWDQLFDAVAWDSVGTIDYVFDEYAEQAMLKAGLAKAGTLNIAPSFTLANPAAVNYLNHYGFDRITQINESTKGYLSNIIIKGMEEGSSYQEVARDITNMFDGFNGKSPLGHIKNRAELIAVTETGNAYEEAALIQSKALGMSGLPMLKAWNFIGDERTCDACFGNASYGWIDINASFPSGHQRPLAHPGCRCAMLTRMAMPDDEKYYPNAGKFARVRVPAVPAAPGFMTKPYYEQMPQLDKNQRIEKQSEFYRKIDMEQLRMRKEYLERHGYDTSGKNLAASGSENAKVFKANLVDKISKETGIEYGKVNDMIHQWASTSNDNNPDSLNIQNMASQILNAPLSTWQKEKMQKVLDAAGVKSWSELTIFTPNKVVTDATRLNFTNVEVKKVIDTVYKDTQDSLERMGYAEDDMIPLWRGAAKKGEVGEVVKIEANTLESWSYSEGTASGFGERGGVLYREVMRKDIVSSYLTGFGCTGEYELLVKGTKEYLAEIVG